MDRRSLARLDHSFTVNFGDLTEEVLLYAVATFFVDLREFILSWDLLNDPESHLVKELRKFCGNCGSNKSRHP